jgi:hypothetical protein
MNIELGEFLSQRWPYTLEAGQWQLFQCLAGHGLS